MLNTTLNEFTEQKVCNYNSNKNNVIYTENQKNSNFIKTTHHYVDISLFLCKKKTIIRITKYFLYVLHLKNIFTNINF